MDKQITSSLQNVFAGQPQGYIDRQTLSGELINHRQHSNWSPVMSTTENEVVTPHVIPMLRSKTNARTIVEPQPTTLRRSQTFPEAASGSIALSSSASASNFFKRAFSRSSSFKRLA